MKSNFALVDVPAIRLRNLTKEFYSKSETVTAVDDVTLEISAGTFTCLMGPSGCGKSTLLHLISGVETPTSGEIWVNESNVSELSQAELSNFRLRQLGIVFQDHRLIPEFTLLENVTLPLEIAGISAVEARTAGEGALERVGIAELANRYPDEVSGGQKQRAGIARGIAGNKRILLADEATGALDRKNSFSIFGLFRELADAGFMVLAATHDQGVSEFADEIIGMEDGHLVAVGAEARS
ncbi:MULTISPECIES: ABC transporter ATP-binding protein [Neomicrococcus]|uniref:ABC transporter domain-containing protein n=1 Tax=Neomicrococcus aestuarii TaxID=556325 RepID=A0A1L2ZPT5_9MICC|nr:MULTISPECIES: ABC transporter ATP-binding protein [Neomicrococcus]APF41149.1 hypothetical protein BHE16_09240 [Neomicrococcus aestuarii]